MALETALQLQFLQQEGLRDWPPELQHWIAAVLPVEQWLQSPLRLGAPAWAALSVPPWPEPGSYAGFLAPGTTPPLDTRRAALFLLDVLAPDATPDNPAP